MKRYSIFIMLLMLSCSTKKVSRINIEEVQIPNQSEKHYYSLFQEENDGASLTYYNSFYIEIQEPKLVNKQFTYSEIIKTAYLEETDTSYIVQLKPKHTFYKRYSNWDEALDLNNEHTVMEFYALEIPAMYESLRKSEVDTNQYIFRVDVLKQAAKIIRTFQVDSKLKPSYKAGYWTDVTGTNMSYTDSGVAWSIIHRVEMRLIELGYKANVNAMLDDGEIEALKKYTGYDKNALDIKTLKKMGIQIE